MMSDLKGKCFGEDAVSGEWITLFSSRYSKYSTKWRKSLRHEFDACFEQTVSSDKGCFIGRVSWKFGIEFF